MKLQPATTGRTKSSLNRVRVNQLLNHVNAVAKMANGEWFVVNAGDDISHKDRTTILMKNVLAEWRAHLRDFFGRVTIRVFR